jgi:hypothetical protein
MFMDWVYNHHNGQSKESNSDWSRCTFQRAADSVLGGKVQDILHAVRRETEVQTKHPVTET